MRVDLERVFYFRNFFEKRMELFRVPSSLFWRRREILQI